MMDELLEYINGNEHLKFIVSLDNGEAEPTLYNCSEWGDLYSELGDFGNDPMILNGDEDLNDDGYPDHYIWNTLSPATTYSAYAFIDHNMVLRYKFDMPNLYDFQYTYIPTILDEMHGCTDITANNYNSNANIFNNSCTYCEYGDYWDVGKQNCTECESVDDCPDLCEEGFWWDFIRCFFGRILV